MPRRYAPLAIALLAVVLLASGCARPAAQVSRTPSPVPTAPPPPLSVKPARPVVWTAHQLPPGLKQTGCYLECPALAQSDGATAYLCSLVDGQAQIWATHDRGAHWTVAGSVPVSSSLTECDLIVDALQPRQALLRTYRHVCCAVVSYESRIYLTTDGGVTWTPRDAPAEETPIFSNLASVGGVSYALAGSVPRSACSGCYNALFMSKDGMRTWRRIDAECSCSRAVASTASSTVLAGIEWRTAGRSHQVIPHGAVRVVAQRRSGGALEPAGMARSGMVDSVGSTLVASSSRTARLRASGAPAPPIRRPATTPIRRFSRSPAPLMAARRWLDTGGDNSYHVDAFAQASDGALLAVTPNPFRGEDRDKAATRHAGAERVGIAGRGLAAGGECVQQAQAAGTLARQPPANGSDALTTVYTATYP